MNDTIVIVYNGGAYGTYLEWCLTTLSTNRDIQEPFALHGSSHGYHGNLLTNLEGWKNYLRSDTRWQFVRLHPKTSKHEKLTDNLLEIANNSKSIIYLYPDNDTVLLNINNWFHKVYDSWVAHSFKTEIDPRKIYDNWPVDRSVPVDQIPRWVLREFLSFYLMPSWFSQVEWNHLDTWKHDKSINITLSQLLFDFESTLLSIQNFCGIEFVKPISSLTAIHQKNLSLQKFIPQDRLCHQIVSATIDRVVLSWDQLPLPSEAWIQWKLRNQGFEIRCDGLDTFPTNSLHLRELLYPL